MLLLITAVAVAIALALVQHHFPHIFPSLLRAAPAAPPPLDVKSEKTRPFGTWPPVKLTYPAVEPWTEFDVDTTKPIPFRPFRWGPNVRPPANPRSGITHTLSMI